MKPAIFLVLEHLPPQQGLRLKKANLKSSDDISTRTSSTTTRIKTHISYLQRLLQQHVLEHLPPQQGLRLGLVKLHYFCVLAVLEHLPPQQGLRPSRPLGTSFFKKVLEHLPPQQGLRHILIIVHEPNYPTY